MLTWQKTYLTHFRASLAHRIPLYVPPATFTPEEGQRYSELEFTKTQCNLHHEWDRLEDINSEQSELGRACPVFVGLLSETTESDTPVYLHPQMICDAQTILEFTTLYLEHWHSKPQ